MLVASGCRQHIEVHQSAQANLVCIVNTLATDRIRYGEIPHIWWISQVTGRMATDWPENHQPRYILLRDLALDPKKGYTRW